MTSSNAVPTPAPRDYAPGDLIASKYLLQHVLGSGGMGTVWAATNLDLELEVALKVVNPGADREEIAARLAIEARAEAKLQHPGIVRVLDLGITASGEPFLVMERLEGESLASLLSRVRRLNPVSAVRTMLPVLDALRFAHSRNVIHRDLKPDNIFLSQQAGRTQPKIVDFGIAKLGEGTTCRRRTGRGAVVGSPGYMSPEHARGKEVDHRADIFTACLVLYECITGAAAFDGDSYNALLRAVIEQELPPITWFGYGDPTLATILERGLEKDPARRLSSCDELGRALATWLAAQGVTDDLSGAPLHGRWLVRSTASTRSDAPAHRSGAAHTSSGTPGSGHSVALPTAATLAHAHSGKLAFAALVLGGFLVGFAATTSLSGGAATTSVPSETGAVPAHATPASAAMTTRTRTPSEPVVTPVPTLAPAAATAAAKPATRTAVTPPALPRHRTPAKKDPIPYPVPEPPPAAFTLPSEPALRSVADVAATRPDAARSELKDPYQ